MIYSKGSQKSENRFSDITTILEYLRSDHVAFLKTASSLPYENHQFFEGFELFWNQRFFILKKKRKKKRDLEIT
jgi:hypothetical protein